MRTRINKYGSHISPRTGISYEHYHVAARVARVHDKPQLHVHLVLQPRGPSVRRERLEAVLHAEHVRDVDSHLWHQV